MVKTNARRFFMEWFTNNSIYLIIGAIASFFVIRYYVRDHKEKKRALELEKRQETAYNNLLHQKIAVQNELKKKPRNDFAFHKSIMKLLEIAKEFRRMKDYKDAPILSKECEDMHENIQKYMDDLMTRAGYEKDIVGDWTKPH